MKIVLMNDNTIKPTRASKESADLDLYSSIDVAIKVGSIKKVYLFQKILMGLKDY